MDNFREITIKRLIDFYKELDEVSAKSGTSGRTKVLFATKYLNNKSLASLIELYDDIRGDIVLIGENKIQSAEEKFSFLKTQRPDLTGKYYRVMIGNLQKNKINKALGLFDEIWSVDSRSLAREINSRLKNRRLPVFLEINVSGERSKHGISIYEAQDAIYEVKELKNLKLTGLLTMAPISKDRGMVSRVFVELRKIADKYGLKTSMGMSGDWKEAVLIGSDYLRIGQAIFS